MTPPPRVATFVVDDPRGALPAVEVSSPWWMESSPLVEAAREAFGVEITVVRLLSGGRFPGGPVTYLVEAPDIDPSLLMSWPSELADDPLRARHAEIGAIPELVAWVDEVLQTLALRRSGAAEQIRTWNLSCLLRIRTVDDRSFWLKAVPDFFAHESDVMRALTRVDATLVPPVVAARPGVTLMEEVGDRDGYGVDPHRHFAAVRRFDAARRRLDGADLATVPRFTAEQMTAALASLGQRHGAGLSADERAKLERLTDEAGDRWAMADVAETLVHGDLHGGNLRLSTSSPDAIIDWGDASVSHPLFDLAVLDSYTPEWGSRAANRWLDLLGVDRTAWTAFRPLAAIRLAIVYRSFCDRIEASEQIYHHGDIVPAIRTGLSFFDE